MNNASKKNRATERALRESEEKYRDLFNSAQDLIHIVDVDGLVVDVNDTELAALGYRRQEFIGKPLTAIIHPDFLEGTKKAFSHVMKGKAIHAYETALITSNGDKIDIEASVTPCMEAGKVTSAMAICRDISKRKRAGKALQESEMRFTAIVQTAPDAIISIDEDQRIILFNKGAEDTFAYQSDEVLGKPLGLLIPERFRGAHEQDVANFASGRETARYMDSRNDITCLKKNGEEFVAEASISSTEVSGKKVMSVILRDISDRKRAEEQLSEQRRFMQAILDNAPVGIWLLGTDHRIKFINPTFCNTVGVKERLFLQVEHYSELLPEDVSRGCMASDKTCFDTRAQAFSIEEIPCVDGKLHSFEIIKAPIFDDQGVIQGLVALATDITGPKQKEASILRLSNENRRLAQRLLHVQEQERQNLARELHDELGQNLTMIKTELGRAASRTWNRKELAEVIKTIDKATDQMIASTRTMLQRLRPATIDSVGLQGALAELAKNWERKQSIPCTLDSSGDLDNLNDNIRLALYRILQESLTNIARHARAKRVQVHCHRHKPSKDDDKQLNAVTLIVADDGAGLPVNRESHQGLGLIGMRERVHALGGNLEIKSAPNKGTRIVVILPLEKKASS